MLDYPLLLPKTKAVSQLPLSLPSILLILKCPPKLKSFVTCYRYPSPAGWQRDFILFWCSERDLEVRSQPTSWLVINSLWLPCFRHFHSEFNIVRESFYNSLKTHFTTCYVKKQITSNPISHLFHIQMLILWITMNVLLGTRKINQCFLNKYGVFFVILDLMWCLRLRNSTFPGVFPKNKTIKLINQKQP